MDHQILKTYNQAHYQQDLNEPVDEEVLQLYKLTQPVDLDEINVDLAWDSFTSKLDEQPEETKVIFWKPLLKVAAMILVTVGMGLFTYQFVKSDGESTSLATIEIDSGLSKKQITLPDGSIVWMNQGSTLSYPEQFGKTRNIAFEGEGYFEITKSNSPFIIEAPDTKVKVLGTAFNLKTSDRQDTRVSVTEGTVAFSADESEQVVTVGEEGIFNKSNRELSLNQDPDVNAYSWKTGHFVFNNMELSRAVGYLNKYYEEEIKIDQKMKACKVTGTFSKLPINEVLEEIALILSAEVTNQGETYLISGEGC